MPERLSHLPIGNRTIVMGILNVTPDSFSDGGAHSSPSQAVDHALRLIDEGADIIDIGGESSRPGASAIPVDEEIHRLLPVVEALRPLTGVPLCVDTWKPDVVAAAAEAGIDMVNTIKGVPVDEQMLLVVAKHDLGIVLMHMRGNPVTMQQNTAYEDLMGEIVSGLESSAKRALVHGLRQEYVWLDPGVGFGKALAGNLEILRSLPRLCRCGHPVMVGTSRKSFLGELTGRSVEERLAATLSSIVVAVTHGAHVVRVHDVKEAVDSVRVCDAILQQRREAQAS